MKSEAGGGESESPRLFIISVITSDYIELGT